jgi:hypothetical protein
MISFENSKSKVKAKGKKKKSRINAPRTKGAEDKKSAEKRKEIGHTRHTNRRAGIFTDRYRCEKNGLEARNDTS